MTSCDLAKSFEMSSHPTTSMNNDRPCPESCKPVTCLMDGSYTACSDLWAQALDDQSAAVDSPRMLFCFVSLM